MDELRRAYHDRISDLRRRTGALVVAAADAVDHLTAALLEGDGARAVAVGDADLLIAGGVESMSRAPLVMPKASEPWARGNVTAFDSSGEGHLGEFTKRLES